MAIVFINLRGKFILGEKGTKYVKGKTGGAAQVILTKAQIPAHKHVITTSGNHKHNVHSGGHWNGSGSSCVGNTGICTGYISTGTSTGHNGAHTHAMANTGGGQAHENMPPYYVLAWIMKK